MDQNQLLTALLSNDGNTIATIQQLLTQQQQQLHSSGKDSNSASSHLLYPSLALSIESPFTGLIGICKAVETFAWTSILSFQVVSDQHHLDISLHGPALEIIEYFIFHAKVAPDTNTSSIEVPSLSSSKRFIVGFKWG